MRLRHRDGDRCFWCGTGFVMGWTGPTLPDDAPTIDHVIPRSKGGTNDLDNLLLACNKCNNKRGDQMPSPSFWRNEFLR